MGVDLIQISPRLDLINISHQRICISFLEEAGNLRKSRWNFACLAGAESLGKCLYVSGVPGTGKTASVLEVIKGLRKAVEIDSLPNFQFVELNSLRLPSPQHIYTHLFEVHPAKSSLAAFLHQMQLKVDVLPLICLTSALHGSCTQSLSAIAACKCSRGYHRAGQG